MSAGPAEWVPSKWCRRGRAQSRRRGHCAQLTRAGGGSQVCLLPSALGSLAGLTWFWSPLAKPPPSLLASSCSDWLMLWLLPSPPWDDTCPVPGTAFLPRGMSIICHCFLFKTKPWVSPFLPHRQAHISDDPPMALTALCFSSFCVL